MKAQINIPATNPIEESQKAKALEVIAQLSSDTLKKVSNLVASNPEKVDKKLNANIDKLSFFI